MKENGAVPEPIALTQELARLRAELLDCSDRTERRRIIQDMSMTEARLELARKRG